MKLAALTGGGLALDACRVSTAPDWKRWTSGLNPELEDLVVDGFLEKYGQSSLASALKAYSEGQYFTQGVSYGGLDGQRLFWGGGTRFAIIGQAKISTEGYPGGQEEDFIQVMYGIHPDFGPKALFPFVVGIKRKGIWQQAIPRVFNVQKGQHDAISIGNPVNMERWLNNEVAGHAADVFMYFYFQKPKDWNEIDYEGYKNTPYVLRDVMDSLKGNYIQRLTANHDLVKGMVLRGSGESAAIISGPSQVLGLLNPQIDPGFFVSDFSYEGAVFRPNP